MNQQSMHSLTKPQLRPKNPRFSSGPCTKHPGWNPLTFQQRYLGRNHRAQEIQNRLQQAIDRSAKLLCLPDDWQVAIVPASDTGAMELAMWNLLGERAVDVLTWESFSQDWADDIQKQLKLENVYHYQADYGDFPDTQFVNPDHDVVFVYNGTTSGVRVPNLDWISDQRKGLTICDATSAVFAMPIEFKKLDVISWSWQKSLGGEAGLGMLAFSPRAIKRLECFSPDRPLPKIFRLNKDNKLNRDIFSGSTLNTPSLLTVEDLHSCLDWAESIGGLSALIQRCNNNFSVVDQWVANTNWVDWLAKDSNTLSTTSLCLQLIDKEVKALDQKAKQDLVKHICNSLEQEDVAYDIASHRNAPIGLRIWAGPTVETSDLEKLLPWIDWAYKSTLSMIKT